MQVNISGRRDLLQYGEDPGNRRDPALTVRLSPEREISQAPGDEPKRTQPLTVDLYIRSPPAPTALK